MKVEAFRCWNDKTWDTEVIEIEGEEKDVDEYWPEDYENIEELIIEYYQACTGIEFCGLYHIPEQEAIE